MFDGLFKILCNFPDLKSDVLFVNDKKIFKYNIRFNIKNIEFSSFKKSVIPILSDNVKVYCNNFPINDFPTKDIDEQNDDIKVVITLIQNKIPEEGQKVYFFRDEDFYEFECIFLKEMTFNDLIECTKKIQIDCYNRKSPISTSLFSTREEKLNIPDILYSKAEFKQAKICALPSTISRYNYDCCKEASLVNFLSLVSERKISEEEFIISFQKNAILKVENVNLNLKFFDVLGEIFFFIFEDSKTYYEKLVIFRNVFSDSINRQEKLQTDRLKIIIKEIQSNYNLFIEDKLKKYISDKQKLTEDFTKLIRNILNSSKTISNNISQQLLILIGTILTTFILKNVNTRSAIFATLSAGLIYLVFLLFTNYYRGWNIESNTIAKEYEQIKEMYGVLYEVENSYLKKLEKKLDYDNKLKHLERLEIFNLIVIFIFIIVLLVALIAVIFNDKLYLKYDWYKAIIDWFIP